MFVRLFGKRWNYTLVLDGFWPCLLFCIAVIKRFPRDFRLISGTTVSRVRTFVGFNPLLKHNRFDSGIIFERNLQYQFLNSVLNMGLIWEDPSSSRSAVDIHNYAYPVCDIKFVGGSSFVGEGSVYTTSAQRECGCFIVFWYEKDDLYCSPCVLKNRMERDIDPMALDRTRALYFQFRDLRQRLPLVNR